MALRRRDVRALRQQSEEWRWSALDGEEDEDNGGRTGWPPGMLQDDSPELSRWLASKPDARLRVREVAAEIDATKEQQE